MATFLPKFGNSAARSRSDRIGTIRSGDRPSSEKDSAVLSRRAGHVKIVLAMRSGGGARLLTDDGHHRHLVHL
tara:strand:- start:29786 stop:30004 length:219 start_codon:yes stop_codon:yes gene_type:complete